MTIRHKVWYQFIICVCPICGRIRKEKFRMINSPKPIGYDKTHTIIDLYDYCQEGEG